MSTPEGSPSPRQRVALRRRVNRAPVTYRLIGVTLAVFLLQLGSQAILGFDLVATLGAKDNRAIAAGQIWRFFTPVFIHGGVLHFFVNMYSLHAIGPAVEIFFGAWRTLALYLLSGIAGVVLSIGFSPYRSVGASGAIFGLLGALGALLYSNRSAFGQHGAMQLRQIILVALLNLGLGLSPGIDNWGHLGGLLYGGGLAWFVSPDYQVTRDELTGKITLLDQRPWTKAWRLVILGAIVIVLLASMVVLITISG